MASTERVGAYDTRRPWHGLDTGWMRYGACNTGSLTVEEKRQFFADTERGVGARRDELEAKKRCWTCPVSPECLAFAVEAGMRGIWGGLNQAERRGM